MTQSPFAFLVPPWRQVQDATPTWAGSAVVEKDGQGMQGALEPTTAL